MQKAISSFALVALLSSCSGSLLNPVEHTNTTWTLIKMELDRSLLRNKGIVPLFQEPQPGMGTPKAQGSLRVNERGKVACQVSVFEPISALGGNTSTYEYEILSFFGFATDGGKRLVLEDVGTKDYPLGRATELRIESIQNQRVRVTSFTGTKQLPYVYIFAPGSARTPPIHIPYIN